MVDIEVGEQRSVDENDVRIDRVRYIRKRAAYTKLTAL